MKKFKKIRRKIRKCIYWDKSCLAHKIKIFFLYYIFFQIITCFFLFFFLWVFLDYKYRENAEFFPVIGFILNTRSPEQYYNANMYFPMNRTLLYDHSDVFPKYIFKGNQRNKIHLYTLYIYSKSHYHKFLNTI